MDEGGKSSIPTQVYCCQIVSTENGMYLDISDYEFPKDYDAQLKSFSQTLYIDPAEIQKMFDIGPAFMEAGDAPLPPPPTDSDPELGLYHNKVWNKRYKIRVKSKKTGRKIDLNIKFVKNVIDYTEGLVVPSDEASASAAASAGITRSSSNGTVVIGQAEGSEVKFTPRGNNSDKDPLFKE